MEIIPTIVAVWFVLPFAVTVFGLYVLLFKPFLAYLDARDAHTLGARKEAAELLTASDEKLRELETRLTAAKERASAARTALRDEALAREAELLGATREVVAQQVREQLLAVDAEVATSRQQLRTEAESLAAQMAAHLLGRGVNA